MLPVSRINPVRLRPAFHPRCLRDNNEEIIEPRARRTGLNGTTTPAALVAIYGAARRKKIELTHDLSSTLGCAMLKITFKTPPTDR